MAEATTTSQDTLLGKIVVENGLATSDEVARCRKILQKAGAGADSEARELGDILVKKGIITKSQFECCCILGIKMNISNI